jgi:hypothetical protein
MLPPGVLPGVFGYNTQESYFGILPTAGKQRRNTVNPPAGRSIARAHPKRRGSGGTLVPPIEGHPHPSSNYHPRSFTQQQQRH